MDSEIHAHPGVPGACRADERDDSHHAAYEYPPKHQRILPATFGPIACEVQQPLDLLPCLALRQYDAFWIRSVYSLAGQSVASPFPCK